MAIQRPRTQITTPLAHLPTGFFIIGYPLFWLQLYTHTAAQGVTSPLAWILVGGILFLLKAKIVTVWQQCAAVGHAVSRQSLVERFLWAVAFVLALAAGTIIIIAALKPIHLLQEFDCLQYHYTIPRQHLILGSFAHIPWASDDLFLLPVDFALSTFWFTTVLPNKIPQLIIFFGLIGVAVRLTSALAGPGRWWAGPLAVVVILGTHGFGIQMGTGMLDLTIAYLFLASLDSLRLGQWLLAGVEFTFFFWSKPLMPFGVLLTLGVWLIFFTLARRGKWKVMDAIALKDWRKALAVFVVLSILVAGPFVAKSIYYAATPFFPWAPGITRTVAHIQSDPQAWQSLQKASQIWMSGTKDNYGHGRDLLAFIKHWWLLGVPEKGVNNAFDYPLGLTYLLFIGPFLIALIKNISVRRFPVLSVLAAVIWALWWFSTQQSRFLYIPLLIIFVVSIARLDKFSKSLFLCLLVSLCLEVFSIWGAHKADLGKWGMAVLRKQDQELVRLDGRYIERALADDIEWPSHDVAYAQFPVMVHKENLPHTVLF